MSTEQLQFPFASLDYPGRTTLRIDEVAKSLGVTSKHIGDLISEGKLCAIDARGHGASRSLHRIPIESYRDYIVRSLTTPMEKARLLRDLPKATLLDLQREIKRLISH